MKAGWIAWMAPALLALAVSGQADAGGYGHGDYGGPGYKHGHRGHGYKHGHRGHGYKGYRHGYRSGYRHAYRRHGPGHAPPHRAWARSYHKGYHKGYRKGYRHGYRYRDRHGYRRSYYPDAYYYDPLLGHVRGIYYPSGSISLHFGY
jgi:hypothetical protein